MPHPHLQTTTFAEIKLYGDCVLRFVSGDFEGPFLPGWQAVEDAPHVSGSGARAKGSYASWELGYAS